MDCQTYELEMLFDQVYEDLVSWRRIHDAVPEPEREHVLTQYIQLAFARFPDHRDENGGPTDWLMQLCAIHMGAVSGTISLDTAIEGTEKLLHINGDEGVLAEALAAIGEEETE